MARQKHFEPDSATSISEQAAHWWVVLNDGIATHAEKKAFGEWVARGPDRVEAYLQTADLMQTLKSRNVRWPSTPSDVLIREAQLAPPEPLPFSGSSSGRCLHSAPSLRMGGGQFGRSIVAAVRQKPRNLTRPLLAVAVVAVAAAWLMSAGPQQFRTKLGEQRSVVLDDGSRVTLNTTSKIEVDLRKDRRLVRLVEGEAFFEVAHDVARPFDVQAGHTMFRAVGTEFNVDLRPSRTTLTVVEGHVAVLPSIEDRGSDGKSEASPSPKIPGPNGALVLAAAERLVITDGAASAPEHVANVTTATSWTQRQLVFEHRPLVEVAEEFNRYNRPRIEIEGAALQQQEVTGVFRSDDPASFLSFLSNIPGVEVREAGDGDLIVTEHTVAAPHTPGMT
jgi:transmembrane sensor